MNESGAAKTLEAYKLELNKQLEDHKHTLAERIEREKARNDRFMTIYRTIFEYAQIGIRYCILVNGAGVTAILTLLGIKQTELVVNRTTLGIAAVIFAIGVFAGFAATIFAYLNQYQVARMILKQGGDIQLGIRWERTAGLISVLIGLGAFLLAVCVAIRGYLVP